MLETLNSAGHLIQDRPMAASAAYGAVSRRVRPVTSAGVAVGDGSAPQTAVESLPALSMESVTRRELSRLTHTLFLSSGGSRAVTFSGVQSGAGCSWMLVRTVELLADAGAGSVCVVDANFRAPMLHRYLGVSNCRGLSDALIDPRPVSEFVQQLGGGLYLLSSGSVVPKEEPRLASSTFRLRVNELRTFFDFVLFDTPPLAVCSHALVVASSTDGLAMVVEADSTNRETAMRAVKDAATANVRMLGVVLNKRTYPIPDAIYRKL